MISDETIKAVFEKPKTIAVYGMSRNPEKPANYVPAFLKEKGYNIIPVNPTAEEILGLKCFSSLEEIPGRIDVVQVFRPSAEAPLVAQEVLRRRKERGDVSVFWLQLGIVSLEAGKLAGSVGMTFIENRCMLREFKRLFPEEV